LNASRTTGRPSIISASLETDEPSDDFDATTTSIVAAGLPVVVAAGNRNSSDLHSPARAATAFTVGAIDITDTKASFSNFGSGVDIYAPGDTIFGAFDTSDFATSIFSGTSQATPHVSGLVAIFLSQHGKTAPATILSSLSSETGVIQGLRELLRQLGTWRMADALYSASGSINRLAVGPITV
jgi:cerevisin